MVNKLFPRTVIYNNVTYHVDRLYSSGLGSQYACTFKPDEKSPEKTILLTDDFVEKHPEYQGLLDACSKRFDDSISFAKYQGSSSFQQS